MISHTNVTPKPSGWHIENRSSFSCLFVRFAFRIFGKLPMLCKRGLFMKWNRNVKDGQIFNSYLIHQKFQGEVVAINSYDHVLIIRTYLNSFLWIYILLFVQEWLDRRLDLASEETFIKYMSQKFSAEAFLIIFLHSFFIHIAKLSCLKGKSISDSVHVKGSKDSLQQTNQRVASHVPNILN